MSVAQMRSEPVRLSVEPAPADDLLSLARSRDLADRQRLLLGVAALCAASPPTPGDAAHQQLGDIFLVLARQAERDVRRALAENLAEADWAPRSLVAMLALDEIEIARPVIASSPLLHDADLLRVLVEATVEHQIEVARRPRISARVADAIIDQAEPAAMTALAGNGSAEIGEAGVQRLVEASRRIAALRAPLIRHPRLNTQLAEQLYGWVGQSLRQAIQERFPINAAKLRQAVVSAVQAAVHPTSPGGGRLDHQRDEMERRLIDKLEAAGQLRPGYLIRAVREGRLGLFENALATLGAFALGDVRNAVRDESPDMLALACAAVGIDRAVYPALLDEIRQLSDGFPRGDFSPRTWPASRSQEGAAREFRNRSRAR